MANVDLENFYTDSDYVCDDGVIDRINKTYKNLIDNIALALDREYYRCSQAKEDVMVLSTEFNEPEEYNTCKRGKLIQNTKKVNLIGVLDKLYKSFMKHKTWKQTLIEVLEEKNLDLAIYIMAFRQFVHKYKYRLLFIYNTEMNTFLSSRTNNKSMVVEFTPRVLYIDLNDLWYLLDSTKATLWQMIKSDVNIYRRTDDYLYGKTNFMQYLKNNKFDRIPRVYYHYIEHDDISKKYTIKSNLFI